MITGEIKNKIDSIWDAFWTGGITNPMNVLEQMTYLFFMKMLDDAQKTKEANASIMGVAVKDPTFKEGMWHNPDTDKDVPFETLRWSVFKNKDDPEKKEIDTRYEYINGPVKGRMNCEATGNFSDFSLGFSSFSLRKYQ